MPTIGTQREGARAVKPWHLTTHLVLSFWDRLRFLFGVPIFVRFYSPDGECHAACEISAAVRRNWPADGEDL